MQRLEVSGAVRPIMGR